jgi:Protein of unknown function (DUF1064).
MNKYRNIKDGDFDSKKEKARYADLLLLERGGVITGLKRQVPFTLIPRQDDENGKMIERPVAYIADFVYNLNGEQIVEDTKSPATRKDKAYVIKRKLMLFIHGIRIREGDLI